MCISNHDLSHHHPSFRKVIMPQIGFGTYKFKKKSGEAERAVLDAFELGYRHVDTAFIYGGETTEVEVGNAIALSTTIPRKDMFVTTKQWRAESLSWI
jgi:2,5-diketo-D-gluconate reductase A